MPSFIFSLVWWPLVTLPSSVCSWGCTEAGALLPVRTLMNGSHISLCLSDDEDGSWLLLSNDKEEPPAPESRIQNLYVGKGDSGVVG